MRDGATHRQALGTEEQVEKLMGTLPKCLEATQTDVGACLLTALQNLYFSKVKEHQ